MCKLPKYLVILMLTTIALPSEAQSLLSDRKGQITFFSSAPLEDIEATNKNAVALFNRSSGEIAVVVSVSGFVFEKRLMQKHFNEQYMESGKYPEAKFAGFINLTELPGGEPLNGRYHLAGNITIHGITGELNTMVTLSETETGVSGEAEFIVLPAEFGISVPSILARNIADEIKVNVSLKFEK